MNICDWIRSFSDQGSAQVLSGFKIGGKKQTLSTAEMQKTDQGFEIQSHCEGVQVRLKAKCYPEENAIDWVLWLKNTGTENSPILSEIWTADLSFAAEKAEELWQEGINGDRCNAENFMPFKKALPVGSNIRMVPEGGKSSNGEFPYFDLRDRQGGAIVAIGWSGQWVYELQRTQEELKLHVGLEDACFYLKPGEEVRVARILLKGFEGDPVDGHNEYRRLILKHYSPKKADGSRMQLPAALSCFDRYTYTVDEWNTEEGQINYTRCAAKLKPMDTLWLDAAWMARGFPNGVGNYGFRKGFPNGVKPVSQEAHRLGLQFLLWFEVERVSLGTDMERDHSDWVLYDPQMGIRPWTRPRYDSDVAPGAVREVLNLGNHQAREFIFRNLTKFIREQGIDIYRQDFTINPLSYWRLNDEEGRKGLTEIYHVMGLYRLWDDLRNEFPGLMIDNCSGGGRRMDLETCMRSVPLWRSDTGCAPITEDAPSDQWNQNQSLSLSNYLVYHAVGTWNPNAYEFRSAATNGIACTFDVLNPEFDYEEGVRCMEEFCRLRDYWLGDYYPMTEPTDEKNVWTVFQLHDREKDSGVLMAFRRVASEEENKVLALRAVDPQASYQLIFSDEERKITESAMSGKDLTQGISVHLSKPLSSMTIEYKKL